MKKETLSLITILGLLAIIAILIFKTGQPPVTNVYCEGNEPTEPVPLCEMMPLPISLSSPNSASSVMMYYKLDDNCNFQTLQFDASGEYAYGNIGRFHGEYLSDGKYRLDKLEIRSYSLNSSVKRKRKVIKIKEASDSSASNIALEITMETIGEDVKDNVVDYTYGDRPDERPITFNKNANIDFRVVNSDNAAFVGGGYECNGKTFIGTGG